MPLSLHAIGANGSIIPTLTPVSRASASHALVSSAPTHILAVLIVCPLPEVINGFCEWHVNASSTFS
jgi:hypothetical protein